MKRIKKFLSLALSILIIFSTVSFSASAVKITIDGEEFDHLPQVYVSGFESLSIHYKDDPSKTSTFPVNFDTLSANLLNFKNYISQSLENNDLHLFHNYLYSAFYDTFSMNNLQGDGITNADDRITCEEAVFEHSGGGVYYFNYDSRLSPLDLAKDLHEFIKQVQEHSGSERFEFVGASYGTTIVLAYLNEYPEMHKYIDSVLFSVPSYGGFSVLGEIFSGDFYIDHDTITQYAFVGMDNETLGLFLSVLNKTGILEILLEALLLPAAKALVMDTATEVIGDTLATIPSIWTFVQEEYFYDAMENVFGENYDDPDHEYAGLISKVIYYQEEIMQRTDEIINGLVAEGVETSIICKYGRPPMPISEKGSFMSDGSVAVSEVTLGATASKYGETLPEDYEQQLYTDYNFLSIDGCIDASTGILPFNTWYVKGLEHTQKNARFHDLIDFIVYENPNVFTSEDYPQFMQPSADGGFEPLAEPEPEIKTTFVADFIRLCIRLYTLVLNKLTELLSK